MAFKDVIGQEKAIGILRGYLERDRLRGGFLFTGPEGVGKKLLALSVAKVLNCGRRNRREACDECPACKKIGTLRHPDLHCIDGGDSEIRIESIRQLQRAVGFKSYEGGIRVFIINDAHRLNPEASNALLKILEEPPPASVFFLITDKPELLFGTVVSRCKTVKCVPLNRRELEKALVERWGRTREQAHYAAFRSEGSIGRALGMSEAGALTERDEIIDTFFVPPGGMPDMSRLATRDDVRRAGKVLSGWVRDMCMVKYGMESEVINRDRLENLREAAGRYGRRQLFGFMGVISESMRLVDQNLNVKLILSHVVSSLQETGGDIKVVS
ncbi:MAG: DNA polymerase III subunit delta' [Candidatus Omnitrophica bacterium]|nr:DNA polymerase III subunit delta' [Candidatus Omnitrophota bacterium]